MPAPAIDAEIAAALANFPIDLGLLSDDALPQIRAAMASMPRPPLSDAVIREDHRVPAANGEPALTLRVHRPVGVDGALPCLYWMHGGGLVLGTCEQDDARFDGWCRQFGLVGVSVEYRLAPETPYPGPLEDCYRGLAWVRANADRLGVRADAIGIGGASAGAGLAAGLALLARDRGELPIAWQLLIYPMLDDRQVTPSSGWEVPVWNPAANTYGWQSYLGDARGGPQVAPYAAPARATELAGLPPTLISVGTADGFVDEDIDYAQRLNRAGVPVELHLYPGAPHGFDAFAPGTQIAQRAKRDMEEWLAAQISNA